MKKRIHKKTRNSISHDPPGTRVKLRFGKHFLPPLAGLAVTISIFGFFNSQLISGQIAYYMHQRRISGKNLDLEISYYAVDKKAPPLIGINKINVKAPVIFDQTKVDEAAFSKALERGVVHYPNTAVPGQAGNIVIFGHSSGQWWASGNHKFVFTLLNKLKFDDKIYIDYQGIRYIYRVNNIRVVPPTDISVLNQSSNHTLTLITCAPVGLSTSRLIVEAQQIVPAVARNTTATTPAKAPSGTSKGQKLPSADDSFWDNLKQLF